MGLPEDIRSLYLAEVQSENIRITQYPIAWAGFNLVSNNAIAAQTYIANPTEIFGADVLPDPCWLMGISLGLPAVEAFQADIRIASGAALDEATLVEFAAGNNSWAVAEWFFPNIWFPKPIRIVASPRMAYNIRKSTGPSAAGFNGCHLLIGTAIGA